MEKRRVGSLEWLLLFALSTIFVTPALVLADIPQSERDALVALYNSMGGPAWTNQTNWMGTPGTENTWYGVMTNPENTAVLFLDLSSNNLAGTIPAQVADLQNLQQLNLGNNSITGQIPTALGGMSNLKGIFLYGNRLSGQIPPQLGSLTQLEDIVLAGNQLSGDIPIELTHISSLRQLSLSANNITGSIPPGLGDLTQMRYIFLSGTMIEGEIPPQLGNLSQLTDLYLDGNFLGGAIPTEIGDLTSLQTLMLSNNKLVGEIPASLVNLTSLIPGNLRLELNALYSTSPALTSFLNGKQAGGEWVASQTVAPAGVAASTGASGAVSLSWTPIQFTANSGGYRIFYSQNPGPPYELFGTTANKSASSMTVTGLPPGQTFYFVIQTETDPHHLNRNTVLSEYSQEVSAQSGLECLVTCSATAPATGTAGVPLAFTSEYTAAGCTGTPEYVWSFGDGSTVASQNATHIYEAPGSYPWSFTVTVGGVPCESGGTVEIAPVPPQITSVTQNHCPDFHLAITGSGFQPGIVGKAGSTVLQGLEWVDQGTVSVSSVPGQALLQLFPVGVQVTISLENPDGGGATRQWARVDSPPAITAQPQGRSVEPGSSVTLSVAASGAGTLCYQWYEGVKGDETSPVGLDSPSFDTPPLAATTSYWVRVGGPDGRADSETATVTVNQCSLTCGASAPATAGAGDPVSFTSFATAESCPDPTVYTWDFGDGSSSEEQTPEHVYQAAGTYSWTLAVTSGETECTRGGTIEILAGCTVECWGSAPDVGRPGADVQFSADVTGTGCSGEPQFSWNFGDGGSSRIQNPAHRYISEGVYDWRLTVLLDGEECNSEGSVSIEPSACTISCTTHASPSSGSAPLEVSFGAAAEPSADCLGEPEFDWQFGDGGSSLEKDPYYTYQNPGTYTWKVKVSQDGATCERSGIVEVGRPSARLSGEVGVWEEEFMLFDGPGVAGQVVARDTATGETFTAQLSAGAFAFANLPLGRYDIRADITYEDHITSDASYHGLGCPAPEGGVIKKAVSSAPKTIDFEWEDALQIEFPSPVVMLHGILSCYGRWYAADGSSPDAQNYWDNAARRAGVISFTPNYTWWGSQATWTIKAEQVAGQIGLDLRGLHATAAGAQPLRYSLIGHGMGGLVARVMTSGPLWSDPVVRSMSSIFTLGTPNSGTDLLLGGGGNTIISVNSIVRQFNEVYPDFGEKTWDVYAIGGDKGWWGLRNGDGPVTLYSAFNISRIECMEEVPGFPQCMSYPAISFDSEEGHVFFYSHTELGAPPSCSEIFEKTLLPLIKPQWQVPSSAAADGGPESPAGGIVWGTNSRTVTSVSRSASGECGVPEGQAQEYKFVLCMSDGMAAVAFVYQGSAALELVDPSGKVVNPAGARERVSDETPPFEFTMLNPTPGEWTLRVIPGPEGASYDAMVVENSPFGISAYPSKEAYIAEETTVLRVDADGDLTEVVFGAVRAFVLDPSGREIAAVDLYDDGEHYDGEPGDGHYGGIYQAPAAEGSYQLRFEASGTFRGAQFKRTLLNRFTVVSTGHVFDGTSTSSPLDRDGSGKMDAVKVTVGLQVPSAVYYEVEGSLYDSEDNWIDYSCASVVTTSAGSATAELQFSLTQAFCGQYGKPFYVKDLNAVDGFTLLPVDSAPAPLQTSIYQAADSDCTEGVPNPEIYALWPDQGIVGQALQLSVSGIDFKAGAALKFDSGITVNGVSRLSENLLSASISILPDASVGYHAATVTNPDGSSAVAGEAFEVVRNEPPEVWINSPWDGDVLKGQVVISASAWDDTMVKKVSFLVDDVERGSSDAFPFQFTWDSRSVKDGEHTVLAVAVDEFGLSASSYPVAVTVDNTSVPGDCDDDGAVSIGEVQRAINMFLGSADVGCGVDCDDDWLVSIGELQKVINAFLGLPVSC